ncbi:uncharacterized protein LOC107369579 [Tetranychus urticae]|uniref:uncharacterized protein LOC107369579 n=1 Tax=Tetranychus urticae TaxID=32264 RepID=UPI00077BD530|nr:uncharacterized protein LOC107369579 [Tetranychus urticae]XP_015793040.1 uncharacterized protein LOC107369579 [Tetranychus urticae]
MFINELPDDCLLIIFDSINELDDLLNYYKVCSKWSRLIAERAKKVKYLLEHRNWYNDGKSPNYSFDFVYYRTKEPIDGSCLATLFPNLIIGEFGVGFRLKVKHEDMVTLVKQIKSFKGLIHRFYDRYESIFQYCDQLEMVSTDFMEPYIQKIGVNIKQLHIESYEAIHFVKDAHYFPNLERLHIRLDADHSEGYYHGPILRRLKKVELSLPSYDGQEDFYGFQFMDSCPNLQSAHIYLNTHRFFVDESIKHKSLQDLVLEFYDPYWKKGVDWNDLKRLLMKYPNLKHLALRSFKDLENEHMEQLVRILPNLVLFAVRSCPGFTRKAANCIQNYNKRRGRSIKFYFMRITMKFN